jgi:redox-sensitive bicupin YhaK (pirin superfamily)
MIDLLRDAERGRADLGWLESRHSFSFGGYSNPERMGFGVLRVINEDRVAPSGGFGRHPHRDMEILSYVLEGTLEHADNLGNRSRLEAGAFQRMTAGTGVVHSEFNASHSEPLHFLQIWIEPSRRGLEPGYQEARLADDAPPVALVASGLDSSAPLGLAQDASVYRVRLGAGEHAEPTLAAGRRAWLQVIRGCLRLDDDLTLALGDGAGLSADMPRLEATKPTEALLFDLP